MSQETAAKKTQGTRKRPKNRADVVEHETAAKRGFLENTERTRIRNITRDESGSKMSERVSIDRRNCCVMWKKRHGGHASLVTSDERTTVGTFLLRPLLPIRALG